MALGEIIRRREHSSVKFTDRKIPVRGILSVFFGILCCALLIGMLVISAAAEGAGSWYVGLGGVGALLLSVIGLILGIKSLRSDNIYYAFPVIGTGVNGILMLLLLALYVLGLIG